MSKPKGLIQYIDERCCELYKNDMSIKQISIEMDIPKLRVKQAIKRERMRENNTHNLNIKLLSDNATVPTRAYGVSAGLDIYAAETVVIEPQEKILLATDIAVDIPEGYVGLLTSRSGVSSKTHLVVETGKIDAGYQWHIKVNVKNDYISLEQYDGAIMDIEDGGLIYPVYSIDEKTKYYSGEIDTPVYKINKGDKIAQLVIVPIVTPEVNVVEEFESESERGTNGFGSSGF